MGGDSVIVGLRYSCPELDKEAGPATNASVVSCAVIVPAVWRMLVILVVVGLGFALEISVGGVVVADPTPGEKVLEELLGEGMKYAAPGEETSAVPKPVFFAALSRAEDWGEREQLIDAANVRLDV
jgi:hypothetical protein